MIRADVLVLPDMPESVEEKPEQTEASDAPLPIATVRRIHPEVTSRRGPLLVVAALAASLLIAVLWGLSDHGGDSMLAMARRDLEAGNHLAAMERMEKYLDANEGLTADDRTEAGRIIEDSGYRIARKELEGGQADRLKRVIDMEARAARRGGGSGRLANLRIQAERGEDRERTLSERGTLSDYGILENGFHKDAGIKSIFNDPPSPRTETNKRVEGELAKAVAKYPDSLDLRLNYGQLLLELYDYERAAEQFTAASKRDQQNPMAETGLGLALYRQGEKSDAADALPHFRKAAALSPSDPAAKENLALCLKRLGRAEESKP